MKRPSDLFAPAPRKSREIPYEFVLDALGPLRPETRPMFGCTAVYVDERVVFILRKKGDADDGVWVAFEPAAEADVQAFLPNLEPLECIPNIRCWRKLEARGEAFEEDVLRACSSVREGGRLIGKLPDRQKKKKLTR